METTKMSFDVLIIIRNVEDRWDYTQAIFVNKEKDAWFTRTSDWFTNKEAAIRNAKVEATMKCGCFVERTTVSMEINFSVKE